MSGRRLRRRNEKAQRHASPATVSAPQVVIRQSTQVERLTYTRDQAAEALGISRTTLTRLLPYMDVIETPWGSTLIPVDELQRIVAERRRPRRQRTPPSPSGRPVTLPPETVQRIRIAHAAGKSYGEIARTLEAAGIPTAHGGVRWWPSTIRAVLRRIDPAS